MALITTHKLQINILLALVILITLSLGPSTPAAVSAQGPDSAADPAVEAIFSALTPDERVGQLFIISFNGTETDPDSDIAELIQAYRIGGVVLSAANENFVNNENTPAQVLALTNSLQALATSTVTGPADVYNPVPLFIGVSQEGNGYPYTQIRSGMIDLPSQMALSATWNTENARLVGDVTGQELSLLGINMLFGPVLDVSDNPRPELEGSLGPRTFGGHPFWVGKLGQAYIQGVHEGSNGRVLAIAKHFPGFGSSDRPINQGVPSILKSLDQLRQTELVPFFKVTNLEADLGGTDGLVDGLMTAHVRYQGLQGNVPISLDARNLPALLALKEIAPWRQAGGLIVSAPLGVPAALEGIAAANENFPARRLAQDAFLAGSDLLLLTNFAFDDNSTAELTNIKNAIGFFREKYASDPNFQAAVDRSVRRIIQAKVKSYDSELFQAEVQSPVSNLSLLNDIAIDIDRIAQAGVTLITPLTREGLRPLASPPQPGDNILIFTDDRVVQDCPDCPEFALIETTALQNIILQLFGPEATGQILPEQITSLSFSDLKAAAATENEARDAETEALIETADWIIFAMLDVSPQANPQSDAVRVLLRNRFDAVRNKNLVLFAFDAPYFLDETEISQLTAYYGFYSKGQDYQEAAARLLFQQFEPAGASPVGIPAIGGLNLSPDPNQTIQLEPIYMIDASSNEIPIPEQAEPMTTLDLKVGEGILFRTSVIMDKYGNPVPDGTLVDFWRFYPLEGLPLEPLSAKTTGGVAEIRIVKERDTPLQVRASSNLAAQSVTFNIGPGIVETPTPTPTSTSLPTDTPTPTATATNLPTATPTAELTPTVELPAARPTDQLLLNGDNPGSGPVDFLDLTYSLLGMIVIGGIAFTLGGDRFSLEERVRPALVAIAMGLVGYIFYTILAIAYARFGIGGAVVEQGANGHWVAPLVSLMFAILGTATWFLKPGRVFSWGSEIMTKTQEK